MLRWLSASNLVNKGLTMTKEIRRSQYGVTLLEIMLVLAIAAMIIVMSIKYYQQASSNQKVNAAADDVTAIIAAGESYLGAVGTLTGFPSNGLSYLPNGAVPNSPWGGVITIGATATANSYNFTIPAVPSASCTQLLNLLTTQNTKLTGTCPAGGSATLTVTE